MKKNRTKICTQKCKCGEWFNEMWVLIRQIIQQLSHNKQWVLTNGEFAKLSLVTNKLDPPKKKPEVKARKRKMNFQSSDLIVFRL